MYSGRNAGHKGRIREREQRDAQWTFSAGFSMEILRCGNRGGVSGVHRSNLCNPRSIRASQDSWLVGGARRIPIWRLAESNGTCWRSSKSIHQQPRFGRAHHTTGDRNDKRSGPVQREFQSADSHRHSIVFFSEETRAAKNSRQAANP